MISARALDMLFASSHDYILQVASKECIAKRGDLEVPYPKDEKRDFESGRASSNMYGLTECSDNLTSLISFEL